MEGKGTGKGQKKGKGRGQGRGKRKGKKRDREEAKERKKRREKRGKRKRRKRDREGAKEREGKGTGKGQQKDRLFLLGLKTFPELVTLLLNSSKGHRLGPVLLHLVRAQQGSDFQGTEHLLVDDHEFSVAVEMLRQLGIDALACLFNLVWSKLLPRTYIGQSNFEILWFGNVL